MSAKCPVCTKTVYALEAQTYDGQDYHKSCFKCLKCKSVMGISSVAKIKGDLFCRPCFKKIFTEKGSYASFGAKTLAKNAPVKDLIASGQYEAFDASSGCSSPVACDSTPVSPIVEKEVETKPAEKISVADIVAGVVASVEANDSDSDVATPEAEAEAEVTAEPEAETEVEAAAEVEAIAETAAEVEVATVTEPEVSSETEVVAEVESPVAEETKPTSVSTFTTTFETFDASPRPTAASVSVDFNRSRFNTVAPKCEICTKSVYPMEIQTYDDSTYHKNCFKCLQCKKTMTQLGSVAKIKGDLYCKPCFKKIFTEKGSYASFGAKTLAKNAPVKDLIASGVSQ